DCRLRLQGHLPFSLAFLFFFCIPSRPPQTTLFPYTTLFRSTEEPSAGSRPNLIMVSGISTPAVAERTRFSVVAAVMTKPSDTFRSEEHTSELQSRSDLVCRLLLEKKKINASSVSEFC